MKNNRLVYILISILTIWLTVNTVSTKKEKERGIEENINNYVVSGFSTDLTKVVDSVKSSVVTVNADGTISSGFVYKQDENKVYVITSYHGIENAISIHVTFDNAYVTTAKVVHNDIFSDIAILEIETSYEIKPMILGDSSICTTGEFVISIGTPTSIDYAGTVELGLISNELISIENEITVNDKKYSYFEDLIQISSNLKPGYSGAPIINMKGEVIGMCLMNDDSGNNFVLPINEIRTLCDRYFVSDSAHKVQLGIKGIYVNKLENYEKSYLNLSLETINGLYVLKVKENSISNIAGVKAGDVIKSINGKDIANTNDYLNAVYTNETSFEFIVNRNNEELKFIGVIND